MKIEIKYMNGKIETYRVDKYLELQDGVKLTVNGKNYYFNYKIIKGWSVIYAPRDDTEFKKWREISRLIQSDIMEKAKDAPREEPTCHSCHEIVQVLNNRIAELEAERDALQARIGKTISRCQQKEHMLYGIWSDQVIDILTGKNTA